MGISQYLFGLKKLLAGMKLRQQFLVILKTKAILSI
jgi:hypothetical protein